MSQARAALLVLLTLGAIIASAGVVSAQQIINQSCAKATHSPALGTRTWFVGKGSGAGTTCSAAEGVIRVSAGGAFMLVCRESTTGTAPEPAESVEVRGYDGPNGVQMWSWVVAGASCASEQSRTMYCTDDGSQTGRAWAGNLKLYIRADRSSSPAYSTQSTTTGTGTFGFVYCEQGPDPLAASAAYSWDTHQVVVGADAHWMNGTARTGLAGSMVVRLWRPDGSELTGWPETVQESAAPGVYRLSVYLGTDPAVGAWLATVRIPQASNPSEYVTAQASFAVVRNVTRLVSDARALTADLWAHLNASFAYTNSLLNATSTYTNGLINASRALDAGNFSAIDASLAHTRDLINATAFADSSPFTVTVAVAGAADGVWAGEPARLTGSVASADGAWRGLVWSWDFGDNVTATGPTAYHAWADGGNYTVRLTVFNALGEAAAHEVVVPVQESVPVAVISGNMDPTQFHRIVYSAESSYDNHSEIVAWEWTVDPYVGSVPLWGAIETHVGHGEGETFMYVWPISGERTLRLTVTNALGHSDTAEAVVTVHNPYGLPPEPSSANPHAELPRKIGEGVQSSVDHIEGVLKFIRWIFT